LTRGASDRDTSVVDTGRGRATGRVAGRGCWVIVIFAGIANEDLTSWARNANTDTANQHLAGGTSDRHTGSVNASRSAGADGVAGRRRRVVIILASVADEGLARRADDGNTATSNEDLARRASDRDTGAVNASRSGSADWVASRGRWVVIVFADASNKNLAGRTNNGDTVAAHQDLTRGAVDRDASSVNAS
jgi:hypothetical protein